MSLVPVSPQRWQQGMSVASSFPPVQSFAELLVDPTARSVCIVCDVRKMIQRKDHENSHYSLLSATFAPCDKFT
jgi:hypothetical protein